MPVLLLAGALDLSTPLQWAQFADQAHLTRVVRRHLRRTPVELRNLLSPRTPLRSAQK